MNGAHSSGARPGDPGLALTCRRVGDDVLVITIAGELDMATVPQARAYLQDKTAARPGHLVLDLTGVEFLGSHGVSLLIDAHEGRDGIHGRLHLTGVPSNRAAGRALDLTGLTPLLDIHDDLDELIRTLAH